MSVANWSALLQRLRNRMGSVIPVTDTRVSSSSPVADPTRRHTLTPIENLCAITDTGRSRDHNEDCIHVSPDGRLMVVADGMGGHEAGEVAAAIAIQAVIEAVRVLSPPPAECPPQAVPQVLLTAMDLAQERILAAGRAMQGHGMGCTLIVGWVDREVLHVAHVGDVRAYLSSAGKHLQITQDHSVVGALVAAGDLTDDEARVHPRKNEVLQALGMPHGLTPDINAIPLEPGDRVLLCSDGLWEMLSQSEIAAIMAGEGLMRQLATQLADRANAAGGLDNLSIILFEQPGSRREAMAAQGEPRA